MSVAGTYPESDRPRHLISALKSGTAAEAFSVCDMLSGQDPRYLENQGVLASGLIAALREDKSGKCHFFDLPDKLNSSMAAVS
ncbi:hypothetical protein LIPSTDRAFT_244255 [Lipomyces starkeyi NRRL Y-11557]|uniref:Uncharacterized protein n=1 Tax=Lipomyces starkeyi NRRL Y-11557 TaxID=675824 RepID=A0A1E3Q8W7_LIPST|nr:hypothetical protein LIPSTDRAFT_244255 [Lipomyces starkeyi NRRL Y-11557]